MHKPLMTNEHSAMKYKSTQQEGRNWGGQRLYASRGMEGRNGVRAHVQKNVGKYKRRGKLEDKKRQAGLYSPFALHYSDETKHL